MSSIFSYFSLILKENDNYLDLNTKNFSMIFPNLKIIWFAFFIARPFMIALKNIIKPAIRELTIVEIITITLGEEMFLDKLMIMHAPPAPLKMPQMSPTTSAQKEHTFSELLLSLSATCAPDCFFSISSKKYCSSQLVTAMPIISKTTLITINKNISIVATITPKVLNIDWLIIEKILERHTDTTNIFMAQR